MKPILTKNRTIGLLGGSFNPAHDGHLHITLHALKKLGLHEVWWLVSPGNPLKSDKGMAPFEKRLASAKKIAGGRRAIHVSAIEKKLGTRYTIDTLRKLKRRYPGTKFIWLMGADNLATIHRWEEWQEIFNIVPILVLDRAPYSHSSLRKKAALRFAAWRVSEGNILPQGTLGLPAWGYVHMRKHAESSTRIRACS